MFHAVGGRIRAVSEKEVIVEERGVRSGEAPFLDMGGGTYCHIW